MIVRNIGGDVDMSFNDRSTGRSIGGDRIFEIRMERCSLSARSLVVELLCLEYSLEVNARRMLRLFFMDSDHDKNHMIAMFCLKYDRCSSSALRGLNELIGKGLFLASSLRGGKISLSDSLMHDFNEISRLGDNFEMAVLNLCSDEASI